VEFPRNDLQSAFGGDGRGTVMMRPATLSHGGAIDRIATPL